MNDDQSTPEESAPPTPEEVSFNEVESEEQDKVAAILAYVPFLCFYALLYRKDNAFAYHHGKQGLVLFIAELAAVALRWNVVWNVLLIVFAAVAVWAMVAALRGEEIRLPVAAEIVDKYFK